MPFSDSIIAANGCTTSYLSREQTEEWKGWMQIMFLLYHYFAAKEFYNVIRVLIASYVWMTGFGNFSYFKLKEDYSLWRVLKMLFRLNFLVFVMCLLMNTDYVLYYICPMHTMWFLSVYAVMGMFGELLMLAGHRPPHVLLISAIAVCPFHTR